jgi:anti-sigma regulatory factor (Ser/Thr protein kinase)
MEIQVPKNLNAVGPLLDVCEHFLQEKLVDTGDAQEFMFAVEEIFTNFVKHQTESCKDITVGMKATKERLQAILTDYDVDEYDFTKQEQADMDALAVSGSIGGRGLSLAAQLMDRLEYHYADRTCTVTITKKRRSRDV